MDKMRLDLEDNEVVVYKDDFKLFGRREKFTTALRSGVLKESDIEFGSEKQRAMIVNTVTMRALVDGWNTKGIIDITSLNDHIIYDLYDMVSEFMKNNKVPPKAIRVNHLIHEIGYEKIRSFISELIANGTVKHLCVNLEDISDTNEHIEYKSSLMESVYECIQNGDLDVEAIINGIDNNPFIKKGELTSDIRLLEKLHSEGVDVGTRPLYVLKILNSNIEDITSYRTFINITLPTNLNHSKIIEFALKFIRNEEV